MSEIVGNRASPRIFPLTANRRRCRPVKSVTCRNRLTIQRMGNVEANIRTLVENGRHRVFAQLTIPASSLDLIEAVPT